jgi:hypothetical protein
LKNQNQRPAGSTYIKNLKEPAVFVKENGKELAVN